MGKYNKLRQKLLNGASDAERLASRNYANASSVLDLMNGLEEITFSNTGSVDTMSIKYEMIIYWSDEDNAFIVEVPELPG